MGLKQARWVMNYSQHKGSARFVHMVYAIHADEATGITHPYIDTVADYAKISTRQAKRIRAELIKNGELVSIRDSQYKECYRVTHDTKDDTGVTRRDVTHDTKDDTGVTRRDVTHDTKDDTGVTIAMSPMTRDHVTGDMVPVYKERKPIKTNDQNQLKSSSSSKMISDDDEDFNFISELLGKEFQISASETVRNQIQAWLESHPASHVEAAIIKAKSYTPSAPLMYVSSILDGENGRQRRNGGGQRSAPEIGYSMPPEFANIVIGMD